MLCAVFNYRADHKHPYMLMEELLYFFKASKRTFFLKTVVFVSHTTIGGHLIYSYFSITNSALVNILFLCTWPIFLIDL